MEKERGQTHRLFSGGRFINFRPVFLLALSAAVAAFLACHFGYFALLFALFIAVLCAAVLFFRKKNGKRLFGAVLFFVLLALVFCGVAAGFQAVRDDYDSAPSFAGECLVTGTVRESSTIAHGFRLTLDDISVTDTDSFHAAGHKMYLYVFGGNGYDAGTRIRFPAEIESMDFIAYGEVNASAVLDGVKYRASASSSDVDLLGKEFDLFGAVRGRMQSVLFSAMREEQARVAYAMLTGDDSLMDEELLDGYRYGGVAHVFAVSGLNISIIYGLLLIPLKKLRANAAVRVPVVAAVLLFYTGICGFSASPVRSAVMCIVLSFSDAKGMKYDALNSVSFAALAVMLVNPVYFYQVGFRLSVAATGGLIILGGSLARLFCRIPRMPKKLASAVSVALSAQLATFPVLLDSFGYVSALGLFLNLIFVPLASAVYAVLFVCTIPACVFAFGAGVFLWLPEQLLVLLELPVRAFDWKTLLICGFSFGGCAAVWYLLLFLLSDKVNLKALPRACAAVIFSVILTCGMIFGNVAFGGVSMKMCSRYGTDVLFIRNGKETYAAVTGVPDERYAEQIFMKEGITALDGLFLVGCAQDADGALAVIGGLAKVCRAYVSADGGFVNSFRETPVALCGAPFAVGGMYAEFAGAEGLLLDIGGARVLVAEEGFAADGFYRADLLVAESYSDALYAACTPSLDLYFEKTAGKINTYAAGSLQISLKNGIISCKGRDVDREVRFV